MAAREILIVPDRRLRRVARPVERIDEATRLLVRDMFAAMYRASGIGLAAIQIGEPLRVVTIDLAERSAAASASVHQSFVGLVVRAVDSQPGGMPLCSRPLRPCRATCSMRSIISTACCSLIVCPGMNVDTLLEMLPKSGADVAQAIGNSARREPSAHSCRITNGRQACGDRGRGDAIRVLVPSSAKVGPAVLL